MDTYLRCYLQNEKKKKDMNRVPSNTLCGWCKRNRYHYRKLVLNLIFQKVRCTIKFMGKQTYNVKKAQQSYYRMMKNLKLLPTWILKMAKIGYPVNTTDVRETVAQIFKIKGSDLKPGKKWMKLFLQRHPNITKRHSEIISKARALVTEPMIRKWFENLHKHLQEENAGDILDSPERIFNLDETGVQLCPKTGVILAPKNYRAMYNVACGQEKQSITVLCNFSASGGIVTPFIVYPLQRISKEVAQSVPDNWGIGRSESGWMTGETFLHYIKEIFLPWLQTNNIPFPILLLVDGHKSHINLDLHEFCVLNKIILYCLHPNTTHILQPCDVGIFGPLKAAWKTTARKHKNKDNSQITKSNFAKVFAQSFEISMKKTIIVNAFKACGIFPFEPNAVDYSKCMSNRQEEIERDISLNDYKTTIDVIEKSLQSNVLTKYKEYRKRNMTCKSSLFKFWNKCKNKLDNVMLSQSSNIDDSAMNSLRADNSNTTTGRSANNIIETVDTQKPHHEVELSIIDQIQERDNYLETLGTSVMLSQSSNIDDSAMNSLRADNSNTTTGRSANNIEETVKTQKPHHEVELSIIDEIQERDNYHETLGTSTVIQGLMDIENIPIEIEGVTFLLDGLEDTRNCMPLNTVTASNNREYDTNIMTVSQSDATNCFDLINPSISEHWTVPQSTSTPVTSKTAIPLPWYTESNESIQNNILLKAGVPNNQETSRNLNFTPTIQDSSLQFDMLNNQKESQGTDAPFENTQHTCLVAIDDNEPGCSKVMNDKIEELLKLPDRKKSTKRKQSKSPVPLAITSKKFKEYLEQKETQKKRKAEEILIRKIQREQKKAEKDKVIREKKCKEKKTNNKVSKAKASAAAMNETITSNKVVEMMKIKSKNNLHINNYTEETEKSNKINESLIRDKGNKTFSFGDYVVVEFETNKRNRYYVGQVLKIDYENDFVKVKCLRKKASKFDNLIYFSEPSTADLTEVSTSAITNILPSPRIGRRGMITFENTQFDLSLCE